MFRNTVLSSPISLFSSTSSNSLSLFSLHVDPSLPEDSACVLLQDDTDQRIEIPSNDATLLYRDPKQFKLRSSNLQSASAEEKENLGAEGKVERKPQLLTQSILHLQSPTISTTFIRSPPLVSLKDLESDSTNYFTELGLKNSRIHFQLRPLGSRPLVIEIGIKDVKNQLGRIRLSNFQARPTLYLFPRNQDDSSEKQDDPKALISESRNVETKSPLLHLPLSLVPSPSNENDVLTEWSSFNLDLPYLIPHLHNPSLLSFETAKAMSGKTQEDDDDEEELEQRSSTPLLIPFDRFESIAYVKVSLLRNCSRQSQ